LKFELHKIVFKSTPEHKLAKKEGNDIEYVAEL